MRSPTIIPSKIIRTCLTASLLACIAGCAGPDKAVPSQDEIQTLTGEKAKLQKQAQQTEAENTQLQKQVEVLAALPANVKGEKLYRIEKVKVTRITNLYDKDNDGKKEKLIVYIQPIDQDGDIIKAPGAVDVELWNLENKAENAKLGDWQVQPDELRKLWFAAVLSTNYRLTFDVADKVTDPTEPLTVKVAFTDLLTGKVFKDQYVIKPQPE